jgi:RNA polymerase sigma-70 factor (ECF subfamily)
MLLERLTPTERAVFLLHDVFDYGYDEVAEIVGKSAGNCRQLAVRARRHVDQNRPRFEASQRRRDELAARFFEAISQGDMDGLVSLLAADVEVHGDSGGRAPSWAGPIYGRDRVSRLLVGIGGQMRELGLMLRPTEINGQPGARIYDRDGRLVNVISLEIADGVVQTVRSIVNPEKLGHLGPLGDLRALLQQRRDARSG